MPSNVIDWSSSVIYKIYSKDSMIEHVYIGSTTNFVKRKNQHKNNSNTQNESLYLFIRDNGGWEHFEMEIVEYFSLCKNRNDLRKQEQIWINKFPKVLNHSSAYSINSSFICNSCFSHFSSYKTLWFHNKKCFIQEDPKTKLFIDWVRLEKRRQIIDSNGFIIWGKNVMKLNAEFFICYSHYINHKQNVIIH